MPRHAGCPCLAENRILRLEIGKKTISPIFIFILSNSHIVLISDFEAGNRFRGPHKLARGHSKLDSMKAQFLR
jgi:hypothetical protein